MLYHLLYPLSDEIGVFNVVRYLTFRTAMALLTAMFLSFVLGPFLIRKLGQMQIGQSIRNDGPKSHLEKAGTPTMGGSLIIIAILIPTLLWANLTNHFVWALMLVVAGYGVIGFIDDYLKVAKKNSKGLSAGTKLLGQTIVGTAVALIIYTAPGYSSLMPVPFFKDVHLDLGYFYIPFIVLVIVATSNTVNLTDGLDGLAIGPIMTSALTFTLLAYLAGHFKLANYLQIMYVSGAGDLSIICGAMVGAGLGFLWFNTYPAQVFMGDVGSLSLGGALGVAACVTKNEILLILIGGIFVLEGLSVIIQVTSFKLTGKRVFAMAPIHHHFELKGWAEPKIIVRFWIISIIFSLMALTSLKLR